MIPRTVFSKVAPNVSEIFKPKRAFKSVTRTLTTPLSKLFKSAIRTSLIAPVSFKLLGENRAYMHGCNFFKKIFIIKLIRNRNQNRLKHFLQSNKDVVQYQGD